MELGHGIFVEIENCRDNPIKLAPYGSYRQQYPPVDLYGSGFREVRGVFRNSSTRVRILLMTSSGRHYAKRAALSDTPVVDGLLRNYWSGAVHPIRLSYKGKYFGSNVLYIVALLDSNGEETVVPIYSHVLERRKFRNVLLTEESMSSANALESHLREQAAQGALNSQEVHVFDAQPSKDELRQEYKSTLEVPTYGWAEYHVLYKALTLWERLRPTLKSKIRKSAN